MKVLETKNAPGAIGPYSQAVKFGKHTDLYADCAEYRKMVDLQKLEEEGGAQNA